MAIEQGVREPKRIVPMAREGSIRLWQSRGGGLYGLGYVLTFISLEILEIPELAQDLFNLFVGDGSTPGALLALIIEFFVDTGLNMVYAFIWPALLIEQFHGFGVFLVAFGFATFNRFWRPLVERLVPELKALEPEHSEETEEPELQEPGPEEPEPNEKKPAPKN